MAGDVANPRIWVNADVYTCDVGATQPTNLTDDWDADWEALGLISEDGMVEHREQTVTDHFAYGGILVRTTKSKHKRTIKVTALEDNPVVWGLVNPGSDASTTTGVTTRNVRVPGVNPKAFGIEMRDGDITTRRIIPRGEIIDIGDQQISDDAMATRELTINIYPDADQLLYIDLTDDPQAEDTGS